MRRLSFPFRRPDQVQWIHPSYRDLVVNELVQDEALRLQFFKLMDLEGVKLALSQAGGAKGERRLPLMCSSQSWETLAKKCIDLILADDRNDSIDVIRVLRSATVDAKEDERCKLVSILRRACDAIRTRWDKGTESFDSDDLEEFFQASVLVDPLPNPPKFGLSWTSAHNAVKESMAEARAKSYQLDEDALLEWVNLASVIASNEPRYLKQVLFPQAFEGEIYELIDLIENECSYPPGTDDPDDLWSEVEHMGTIGKALEILKELVPKMQRQINAVVKKITTHEDKVRALYYAAVPKEEEGGDWENERSATPEFDVDALFSDL